MIRSRTPIAALVAAAALVLTGCAVSSDDAPAEPSEAGTPPASTPAASDDQDDDDATDDADDVDELTAMVGTADNPEAYEIALLDDDGEPVTTLEAGEYELTFADNSQMHNFHLTGPGDVDVMTDVAGTDTSTVTVTLVPGTYTFVCDPHVGTMSGTVEVTG